MSYTYIKRSRIVNAKFKEFFWALLSRSDGDSKRNTVTKLPSQLY
uniref:Uncharacterized protein n=1 Tax=uncultured Verrucomicrobiales bacterium HF0200_39L05 TaxID=710997 RepID=E0XUN3_9BACT|nr:hypothetical protein [uncultured Verrucomicrobiales bacterium HF0200_39L05]